jgi:transposase
MPSKNQNNSTISVVHGISCGLDVHKNSVSACMLYSDSSGAEQSEVREFQTFTDDLIKLKEWLLERECPVIAMESTGPYWTPVHNVLEDSVNVILVNARHMRNVPGHKTDISDSRWLAGLLRHGLLNAAFIPPKHQRQWRDLTRMRKNYKEDLGDFQRRVHKLFQQSNIKIDSVVSDLFGATGRNLMKLLISSDNSPTISEVENCLRGSLQDKAAELHRSVQGFFESHHRFLLSVLLDTIENLERQISILESRIAEVMRDVQEVIRRHEEIPGVAAVSSHAILAEIGPTLEEFPSAHALASWGGLSPGNNQSGGKRFSGKSPVRKNHLKTIMVEVAWPAIKARGSYFRAKYYSLRARLGPKKAIIAIAHKILKAIYHVIKDKAHFKDLGETYLLERNRDAKIKYLTRQASLIGYELVPMTQTVTIPQPPVFS